LYGETIGNPLLNVLDIEAVAQVAHSANVPLIIERAQSFCRVYKKEPSPPVPFFPNAKALITKDSGCNLSEPE